MRPRPWTDLKRVPEKALPERFKQDGSYKPEGYHCWECDYITSKQGLSGRQALRAHIKGHVLYRRAWMRPAFRQTFFAFIAGLAAFLAHLIELPLPTPWQHELPSLVLWGGTVVYSALLGLGVLASIRPASNPDPATARLVSIARLCASLGLVVAMLLSLGLMKVALPLWLNAMLWSGGIVAVWFAAAEGLMRYSLRHRKRQPAGYGLLWVATNGAEWVLEEWLAIRKRAESQKPRPGGPGRRDGEPRGG